MCCSATGPHRSPKASCVCSVRLTHVHVLVLEAGFSIPQWEKRIQTVRVAHPPQGVARLSRHQGVSASARAPRSLHLVAHAAGQHIDCSDRLSVSFCHCSGPSLEMRQILTFLAQLQVGLGKASVGQSCSAMTGQQRRPAAPVEERASSSTKCQGGSSLSQAGLPKPLPSGSLSL